MPSIPGSTERRQLTEHVCELAPQLGERPGGNAADRTGVLAVRLLGQLQVSVDGHPVRLSPGRLRTLLAVLAISAGQTVPVARIAAALWDGDLPVHARRTVQTYVARLRSLLGAGLIVSKPDGYLLR